MIDMQIEKALSDTKNYFLLTTLGEVKDVVIGVPHHAPLGVPNLPCKEHPDSDENAGYLGYEVARLLNCNSVIACNSPVDPNKNKDSDYCKNILSWKPKILVEIHGHGSRATKFDVEISSGSSAKNIWSKRLAEKLRTKFSALPLLQSYTLSGDFNAIYFKAKNSFTITTNDWIAFHIELPKSIRKSKDKYSLFCKTLAESMNEILASYNEISESQNQNVKENKKVDITDYAVAYIDLLSQKDVLREINKLPENKTEEKKFISQLKITQGAIHTYRTCFKEFHEANTSHDKSKFDKLSPEKKEISNRILKYHIKKLEFSDTIIYYTPLAPQINPFPITSIHSILTNVAANFITTLSEKLICRGAIEVGIAWEFYKDEIYGPALYQTYRLENEVAKYPRIVIGNEIFKYIISECYAQKDPETDGIRNGIAKMCKDWICNDLDGIKILDYAGKAAKEQLSSDLINQIDKAIDFVNHEYKKFKKDENSKLASRYFFLNNYLQNRKQLYWN